MRLAHFSDPHLLDLKGTRVRDFFNKRWLGGVNLLTNRAREHRIEVFVALVKKINEAGVDHVLCTGDITNVALPSEFRYARALFDEFTLGPDGVTTLAGNHDAYIAQGLDHFQEAFGPFTESDREFRRDDEVWPLVRVRENVAIIGVSTSLETPWLRAWGEVGEKQLARLGELLSDPRLQGKFRIVAIHHPPAGERATSKVRGLHDADAFAAVLAKHGAELVLHGHEHEDVVEALPGPAGSVPVRGIQSATYDGRHANETARFRIYEVGSGTAGARPALRNEELFVWRKSQGDFAPDMAKANPTSSVT